MSLHPPHLPSPAPTPDNPPAPMHNGSTAPGSTMSSIEEEKKRVRDEVETRLKTLQQDLYEMEICAGAVVAGQEERIPMYMKRINEQFIALNDLSQRMQPELSTHHDPHGAPVHGDSVPKQVVDFVDTFRNPHVYTKNALSRATGENQYALGRVLGLESFRRQLTDALGKEMPDLPLPPRRHQPVSGSNNGPRATTERRDGASAVKQETGEVIGDGPEQEHQQRQGIEEAGVKREEAATTTTTTIPNGTQ